MTGTSQHSAVISVAIADDHEIVRDAILGMLEGAVLDVGFDVVATASNGLETIAMIKAHKPELLFLDISMPLASGMEIIHDIRRWSPHSRILVFTGVTAPGLIASIVDAGVDGLFSKAAAPAAMLKQLPLILRGSRHIAPEFVDIISRGQRASTLTGRECQVLNMVVAGKSNREVADILSISPKTVDKHRTSLMHKLDVHSVAQLIARALEDGLIESVEYG